MFQSAVIRDEFAFTGHNAALTAVCFNRHQDCFVSADDSSLRLWRPTARPQQPQQAQPQQRVVSLPPRTANFVQALEYIDSRQLYAASALDGTLKLFDASLNELASVFTKRATVLSLVFDAKRGRLLAGGVDGCAAWQVRGRPSASTGAANPNYELAPLPGFFHGHRQSSPQGPSRQAKRSPPSSEDAEPATSGAWVRSVQLNADASRVFAQSARHVDVFAAADGAFVERHAELFPDEYGALSAFSLHERSQYLVCGTSSGAIFVLSLRPTAVVHAFKDHTAAVTGLAVLEATGLVLSSSLDGSVRLWDLEARRQVHRLDLGQAVQGLRLLPGSLPSASQSHQSLRFYCRVRSAVRIFRIQSTIKEHMACLAPISVLTRIPAPRSQQAARSSTVNSSRPTGKDPLSKGIREGPTPSCSTTGGVSSPQGSRRGRSDGDGLSSSDSSDDSNSSDTGSDDSGDANNGASADLGDRQVVVAAGTDKTIRLFAGRAANEAPSFTWIPEEGALDLIGFALHPGARRLFLLLDSQKLLLVSTVVPSNGEQADGKASNIERVVSFGAAAPTALPKLSDVRGHSSSSDASFPSANDDSHEPDARRASVFRGSNLPGHLLSPSARRPSSVLSSSGGGSSGSGRRHRHASVAVAPTRHHQQSSQSRSGSTSAAASLRGKLCCLCVCFYPPVFHATPPLSSLSGGSSASVAGSGDEDKVLTPATQAKWFSRTLSLKRKATTLAQELKKLGAASPSRGEQGSPERERRRSRRHRLVRSEWEWIACGSEFGHLLFWHTGLGDGDADAISIDAHDAAVVALAASQSSALLVSLDAGHRAHLWHLQPVLALGHLLDLRDKPSCFVLSPQSELLLAGFGDGRVTVTDASDLGHVETFPFPLRGDLSTDADDQQHSAMVSAGDFLDEKRVVLTASVDAVVKVWDQRRNLLRQVAISSALTSLCFMNAHGDVMAGLPAGVFVLSRQDVLPEKLLRSDSRKDSGRGSGRRKRRHRPQEERRDDEQTAKESGITPSCLPTNKATQVSEGAADAGERKAGSPPKPSQQQPEQHQSQQSEPPTALTVVARRRLVTASSNAEALILRINDRPLAAASQQHAPVLRSLPAVAVQGESNSTNSHLAGRLTAEGWSLKEDELRCVGETNAPHSPTPRISVPETDEGQPNDDDADRDWRDSLLPVASWRQLLNCQHDSPASPSSRSLGRRRHREPSSLSNPLNTRPANRHAPLSTLLPPSQLDRSEPPTPLSCSSSRSNEAASAPVSASGLSVGSWDDDRPVLYCKHQAPVPPKDKTPRKLWNAIGGEDRRLLALQRNLLPPC